MNSFIGWTFDARTVSPQVSLEPVPEGWYKVIVKASNIKPTRNPANYMLELQCQIIEGQFQGRILYWNFNLYHSTSSDAVEMARKALSAVSHVVGQYNLTVQGGQDNAMPMLHNIPFYIHVIIAKGDQGPLNNIKACRDVHGNEPGKQHGAGHSTPAMPQQPAPAFQPQPPAQPQAAPGGWQTGPAPQQPAPQQWQAPQAAPQGAPMQPAAPQQPQQPYGAPQAPAMPQQPPQQAWQPGQSQPVPGMPPTGATPWGR